MAKFWTRPEIEISSSGVTSNSIPILILFDSFSGIGG